MQSKDRIRVQHILDEANEACKYTEGISFNKFAVVDVKSEVGVGGLLFAFRPRCKCC